MKIRILYFALLRDAMGREGDELDLPADVNTAGALREWLIAQGEPWASAMANRRRIRAAVNQDMADDEAELKDGDEVAFFPPVTGG